MFTKTVRVFLFLLLAGPAQVFASPENWYAYLSIGSAQTEYPSTLNSEFSAALDAPDYKREKSSLEVEFYWPIPTNALVGVGFNMAEDIAKSTDRGTLDLTTWLYGLSYMRFFGSEPGDGFYFRGDIGWVDVDYYKNEIIQSTSTGYGYMVGIGYALPLSDGERVLVSLNQSTRSISDGDYDVLEFTIGILW